MIRVSLAVGDYVVDVRTDVPFNPEVLDTLARQAVQTLTTATLTTTVETET